METLNPRLAVSTCAVGAVSFCLVKAFGERFDRPYLKAHHRAVAALELAMPGTSTSVLAFNDAPTTTHADVLALFDRAIAKAEES